VEELAEGAGAVCSGSAAEPLADGEGPGDAEGDSPGVTDADGDGEADADSGGSSDRVTHGPGAYGMSWLSAASASRGPNPMPTKTAVGIAASAIALPAGICSLVRSDFLGAA
jgi:hypothetical protein